MTKFAARNPDFEFVTRRFLESMPVFETLALNIEDMKPGKATISMRIVPALTFDGLHVQGGIVGALLDIGGGAAATTLVAEGHGVVTMGFETHHLGPAGGERLVAEGRVVKPGRNQALSLVEIFAESHDRKTLCATGHVTSRWIELPA